MIYWQKIPRLVLLEALQQVTCRTSNSQNSLTRIASTTMTKILLLFTHITITLNAPVKREILIPPVRPHSVKQNVKRKRCRSGFLTIHFIASRTSHPRSTQPVRRIHRGFGQATYESQVSNSTYDNTRNTASQISQHRQPRDGPDNNRGGIRLRPVSDLREYMPSVRSSSFWRIYVASEADMYRALFKFGVFNAVQSECYDEVMHGDDNMVSRTSKHPT